MHSRYGRYVGRVGALAVALGIGSAIAAPAGIAWATEDDATTSSPTGAETGSEPTGAPTAPQTAGGATGTPVTPHEPKTTPEPVDPKPGSATSEEVAPGVTVSNSGGAHSGDDRGAQKPKKKRATAKPSTRVAESTTATNEPAHQARTQNTVTSNSAPKDEPETEAPPAVTVAALRQPAAELSTTLTAPVKPAVVNPVQAAIGTLIDVVVRPVLSAFLGVLPGGATESPLSWVLLGAARRQVGQTEDVTAEVADAQLAATQTVAAAAANQPPTATVTWGRPDATTGKVLGQLSTSDPEGKAVTVTLKSGPSAGTFAYNSTTKVITYTPTTAQRFVAATTANPEDTIGMTVSVYDGVNRVDVPINIPVSPSPFYKANDFTNVTDASAVAVTNTRAYITNRSTGTVTVYDTVKNTVVGTYQVGAAPDGIAVKKDGTRLYVSSSTNNTVTVIDTATGATKKTITIANPTAIAINPSGSTVYVASGTGATISKISTTYNTVSSSKVKLPTGYQPTELAVSADGTKIYVASAKPTGGGNISVFSSSATTVTSITDTAGAPTGLALSASYPRLFATDTAGGVTVIDTTARTAVTRNLGVALSGIVITNDSSTVMVVSNTGLLAAVSSTDGSTLGVTTVRGTATPMSVQPGVVLSPDGTKMFVTDYDTDSVHVVSLVPPNTSPFSSDPSYSVSNPSTGALTGKVGVVDFDGDPLTYVVNTKPTKGTLVLKADGTYTYTPTSTTRHAAAVPGAPDSVTTDSFTITVSDGRNGTVTTKIIVAIDPANKVPAVTTTIGTPSTTTGVVKGSVTATDGNSDKRTYTVTSGPTKGTVTITSTGSFTYTPTAEARAAATAPGAGYDDRKDTFVVTVDDGHGGVVPVTVNVRIGAPNAKPTGAVATVTNTNPRSGVVTGTVTATDANGDPLSFKASATTKGTIVFGPSGTFTYTPTAAARLAASKAGATTATKTETITITVSDGFGGTTTTSLKVSIAPNPTTNGAPTNGHEAPGTTTSTAIGTVTGTVTADDPDGDKLTYSLGSGPAFGTVKVTADGKFTYTPDVDARYRALVTDGVDTDSFVVNISDAFGGTTTATVNVEIAPPSASAIDQRPTTVAVTAQQMYFYSQTDTDKAMGLLKDAGIDTIRILIPWAGVEPTDDTYNWAAVDRMVNSANAKGIKVLAVLNSTPDWAAVPDQPPLSGHPADLNEFSEFVTKVATRYQGKVADYEIWNEPNYNVFWSPTPDAKQYTELLKVAYTAIKAADPNATVIAASVAAAAETPGGPTVNPVTYLSQMYAAGAAGYFDAVSFHPYLYSIPFSAGEGHAGVPITQAEQMYAVMVANGDGNKKIWVTEYGQPSSEVSEANQAAFVGDFLRTWRNLDFAGPAFIHTLADYPSSDPIQGSMGLFHQDWSPKPVLATVKQVIAENNAIEAAADSNVL
ncbi:Ig-like domain-containing protein [Mycobacterium sp. 3519A]|uniref:Ig-like domain-containing protein n=1 Tax=Mycobacterium sp. 3519A TaxID=2057184 RepID=UPI0011591B07|nr:Ig-like domain-containing protein [Mycobacterium sp. 3519A]